MIGHASMPADDQIRVVNAGGGARCYTRGARYDRSTDF